MHARFNKFKNKEVVIVLRGKTSFGLRTAEGIISTNTFLGYFVNADETFIYVSSDSPTEYTSLIRQQEIALLSLAPENEEFTFTETDMN